MNAVAFSHDGAVIVSGDVAGTIYAVENKKWFTNK